VIEVDGAELVMADIPGLIEGASDGAGLGDRFLGHIERCAVNLHLVDGTAEDVAEDYRIIRGELDAYANGLEKKPVIVGLNKIDALTDEEIASKRAALEAVSGFPVMELSGATGKGVQSVLRAVRAEVVKLNEASDVEKDTAWTP